MPKRKEPAGNLGPENPQPYAHIDRVAHHMLTTTNPE